MTIGIRLALGFFTVALLVAVIGYFSIITLQSASLDSIGDNLDDQAALAVSEIDKNIHDTVERLRWYVQAASLARQAVLSNEEFDRMPNREDHISATDSDWIAKKQTPFIQGVLNNDLSNTLKRHVEYLAEVHGYAVFTEMYITNKHGVVIGTTGRTSDYLQADEDWYQAAVAERKGYVRDVEYDESSDSFAIDVVVTLNDDDGNIVGLLKAVWDIEDIRQVVDFMQDRSPYESASAYLVDRNGRALFSSHASLPKDRQGDVSLEEFGEDLSARRAIAEAVKAGDGHIVFTEGDTDTLAVFSRLPFQAN